MIKRLEQLLKKREELSVQIQKLRTRKATQKRKEDTRRKMHLNLIKLVEKMP